MTTTPSRYLYIVASETGSIVSRAIRQFTGAKYNHVSIALNGTLHTMYSFGRRLPWCPFWGGFVREEPGYGTLARFPDTRVRVVRLPVTEGQYRVIRDCLEEMDRCAGRFGYNYLGLFLAALGLPCPCRDRYYGSEFVRDVLVRYDVVPARRFGPVTQPQQLLDELPEGELVYEGVLNDYPPLADRAARLRSRLVFAAG